MERVADRDPAGCHRRNPCQTWMRVWLIAVAVGRKMAHALALGAEGARRECEVLPAAVLAIVFVVGLVGACVAVDAGVVDQHGLCAVWTVITDQENVGHLFAGVARLSGRSRVIERSAWQLRPIDQAGRG